VSCPRTEHNVPSQGSNLDRLIEKEKEFCRMSVPVMEKIKTFSYQFSRISALFADLLLPLFSCDSHICVEQFQLF